MFGLFKKEKAKIISETNDEQQGSEIDVEAIGQDIERINIQLKEREKEDLLQVDEIATLEEKLGLLYDKIGQIDLAIEALEKSLNVKPSINDGYKKLMHLYNHKRAEAAQNRDDNGIEFYMNKMDEMRQIAKKMTLSRK